MSSIAHNLEKLVPEIAALEKSAREAREAQAKSAKTQAEIFNPLIVKVNALAADLAKAEDARRKAQAELGMVKDELFLVSEVLTQANALLHQKGIKFAAAKVRVELAAKAKAAVKAKPVTA
ncbi:MAG: hypothetical protein FD189_1056 [Elusimicrobia bacterium]|nr:MAG: hypothetical protein FD189_1056 [Elusimicrobiota bacterium]